MTDVMSKAPQLTFSLSTRSIPLNN